MACSIPRQAPLAVAMWRRIDLPGCDCCALFRTATGWLLTGTAIGHVSGKSPEPSLLQYTIASATNWTTRWATIRGWIGPRVVAHRITRMAQAQWHVNGRRAGDLDGCLQLDLGFSPSTNLLQLRYWALPEHVTTEVPVAWLDADADQCTRLVQYYRRVSARRLAYTAPSVGYAGELEVDDDGFVRTYPGLWERE